MRSRIRPLLAVVLAAVSVLAFDAALTQAQSGTKAYNATDAVFAAMMLPHHEGGIELGDVAATKGTDPSVRRLGRAIKSEQTREAKTLRRMVRQFQTKKAKPAAEMMRRDAIDMAKLRGATGVAFDRVWLDVISGHHAGAIQMAQMEVRGGRNAAARRLARQIVATQRRELGQFNGITDRLGN